MLMEHGPDITYSEGIIVIRNAAGNSPDNTLSLGVIVVRNAEGAQSRLHLLCGCYWSGMLRVHSPDSTHSVGAISQEC